MSAVADLTRVLIDHGMDPAEAAALVARAGAELAAPTRSKAAERTARWREKQASQTVTERHAVTVPEANDKPSPSVTERHKPSPRDGAHISLSTEDSNKKKERKRDSTRGERLSPDWQPNDHDIAAAIERGVARERIPMVAEKFKNHWLTKPTKNTSTNWHRNWCTWCINEVEWNGRSNGQRPGFDRTNTGARESGTDAVLAGVARAVQRRARERESAGRNGAAPEDGHPAGEADPKLL